MGHSSPPGELTGGVFTRWGLVYSVSGRLCGAEDQTWGSCTPTPCTVLRSEPSRKWDPPVPSGLSGGFWSGHTRVPGLVPVCPQSGSPSGLTSPWIRPFQAKTHRGGKRGHTHPPLQGRPSPAPSPTPSNLPWGLSLWSRNLWLLGPEIPPARVPCLSQGQARLCCSSSGQASCSDLQRANLPRPPQAGRAVGWGAQLPPRLKQAPILGLSVGSGALSTEPLQCHEVPGSESTATRAGATGQ